MIPRMQAVQVGWEELSGAWEQCDALVLMVDMDRHTPDTAYLTERERDTAGHLKSEYRKKSYLLSRTILRFLLSRILSAPIGAISLSTDEQHRVRVNSGDYPWISLSYSRNFLSCTLGRARVGSDMEVLRTLDVANLHKYPAFQDLSLDGSAESTIRWWERWTELEAYAKFSGTAFSRCLHQTLSREACVTRSCIIDDTLMCTLVSSVEIPRLTILSCKEKLFPLSDLSEERKP
jgi:4'-phosphopantetheinyl transferase